jgi:adenylate kinase
MNVFVFMGPPGVGKGTQSGLVASRLGAEHLSTGLLLRNEIASGSELGKAIKSVVESGALVSDELILSCLDKRLESSKKGDEWLLLDGIPRTLPQVSGLDIVLAKHDLKVDVVGALVAPLDELVERFSYRWTCSQCGRVESFVDAEVALKTSCLKCGASHSFKRREDDSPVAVRKRFEVYDRETAPVIDVYRKRGILFEVNGLRAVEKVYVQVAHRLVGD